MIKNRNLILISVVAGVFVLLVGMTFLKPDSEYSETERRNLKQQPELSLESVLSGRFMSGFEEYSLDQFPFREALRSLKASTTLKLDNNALYVSDESVVKMEYPLKEESLERVSERFKNIYDLYLKDSGSNLYLSIIPDKNYFYAKESGHLSMDYEALVSKVVSDNSYMTYVDIFPLLSANDYYKTDTHWKQENLADVAEKLLSVMGNNVEREYRTVQAEGDFYGVYYGQAALKLKPDKIKYLTNDIIKNMVAFDYENNKEIPIYDLSKMDEADPYELYVGGPVSLVTIENQNAETDKELVVFRDSFGSSVAPLLAQGYKKVILVDIRYIQPGILDKYIDFSDKDVLFLYSTLVLNNSETLK